MGASSSGLLDEAKVTNIKELVAGLFGRFSVFYRQQYSAAYFGHLHQEVEPNKEEKGLLLSPGLQQAPEEVLYQGSVKVSCWDEQGKKSRDRYVVLKRDYKVEIYENSETFSRGCGAKLVLQPAGGSVFTREEESGAHLEQTCAGLLSDVKEDSSSVVAPLDAFAVYLHLPYMGHTCFIFQQEAERDHFLSALKTCIRHCNLDPWSDSSYESQAYIRALRLYRQDGECYESWEMLLGTEEKVLASQVMEEVLPWLQSQLQSRVKGKKTERMRQWLTAVQETYVLVVEQLTASLQALKEECRHTATANQVLIRSDLDQIMSSRCFLEDKVRACIGEDAEKVYSESVAPHMTSILEVLTDTMSAGILEMQQTLRTQMDSVFKHTSRGAGDTKTAFSSLRSISLEQCYRQVENLTDRLVGVKRRFGLNSTQRLVHSAHLEMEKLLDSAVYTLELFLQSSARQQPSQIPINMEGAEERVLKQLDYDSRVVKKRLYQEALLEITLPVLTRKMNRKWKSELLQLEQYIFSDHSSFILVHNVYEDVLRNILSKEIETALQDAASRRSNNHSLHTDLATSQYSLLGQTPPRSSPVSPVNQAEGSSSGAADEEPAPEVKGEDPQLNADVKADPPANQESTVRLSPVAVRTQDTSLSKEASITEETREMVQLGPDWTSSADTPDSGAEQEPGTPDHQESLHPTHDPSDLSLPTPLSQRSADVPPEGVSENSATPDFPTPDQVREDTTSVQLPFPASSQTPCEECPTKISLVLLSEAIGCDSSAPVTTAQQTTDRAVYLTGDKKDNWKMEREKEKEATKEKDSLKEEVKTGEGIEEKIEGEQPIDEGCPSSEPPPESTTILISAQIEKVEDEEKGLESDKIKDCIEEGEERGDHTEKDGETDQEEGLRSLQPERTTETSLDTMTEPHHMD